MGREESRVAGVGDDWGGEGVLVAGSVEKNICVISKWAQIRFQTIRVFNGIRERRETVDGAIDDAMRLRFRAMLMT